jgi:hypothetical protein
MADGAVLFEIILRCRERFLRLHESGERQRHNQRGGEDKFFHGCRALNFGEIALRGRASGRFALAA